MSTISAPRPSHKRPHIASPSAPNSQSDDPSSKRQKTVRTYTSTTSTSTSTNSNTNINTNTYTYTNDRPHPLSSSLSSSIISSEFSSSQPDSRGPPLPADFFDTTTSSTTIPTILPLGSQNRAPRPPRSLPAAAESNLPTTTDIDEDEWAAFEADIAETEVTVSATTAAISSSVVITAAPTGPDDPTSTEDQQTREDDAALEREDAQNRLVQEFEEMESLESRVQKLKKQREALRAKAAESVGARMDVTINGGGDGDDEDEEDEEEDDWIHFSR